MKTLYGTWSIIIKIEYDNDAFNTKAVWSQREYAYSARGESIFTFQCND